MPPPEVIAPGHWPLMRRFQGERLARWRRRRPPWTAADAEIAAQVATSGASEASGANGNALSRALLSYFWRGQQHYVDAHGTLADYPGWPSLYGARSDAVEGVTRLLPLWAAALNSPLTDAAERAAMKTALLRALSHGCDPTHPGYWGRIGPRSTLICEAADVALALWLARESLWPALEAAPRDRLIAWLASAIDQPTADNNWHLFAVLIDAVCAALQPAHRFRSQARLARVWSFADADGCWRDGPAGAVDYYNAWGFHYLLFWLRRIAASSPVLPADRSLAALQDYTRWYRWLFTPTGLPLYGRSLCYRMATPVPMQMAALDGVGDAGEALATYVHTWRHFVAEGGLRAGRPTQGVFGEDARWLDPYSGPASSLWGTRSLLLQLVAAGAGEGRPSFAQLPQLPSAQGELQLRLPALGAELRVQAGCSSLVFDGAEQFSHLTPWPWRDRLRGLLYGVSTRPTNNLLRLGRRRFDSTLSLYR